MEIHLVTNTNIELLTSFLQNNLGTSFRYFQNRPLSCLDNHLITVVGTLNGKPISYGHLDKEDKIWLGICVLSEYQGRGYGREIMDYLFDFAKNTGIPKIHLTVDKYNIRAFELYLKCGFKVKEERDNHYLMCCSLDFESELRVNEIYLPVSLGEALDKLTILEIKKAKIMDHRKIDVEKEYNILYEKLSKYVTDYGFYYSILKKINLDIWEMQDDFRDESDEKVKTILCKKIIVDNDRRFRVKNKINIIANSNLKEQKGYKPNKAFILTHLGLGDNITAIGMVRYLSTRYDVVTVVCKKSNEKNVKEFYRDDSSIKIMAVDGDKDISISYGFDKKEFNRIVEGMDVYTCGIHKKGIIEQIPFSFYDDVGLDRSVFWDYFYVKENDNMKEQYELLVERGQEYVFVHNTSSEGLSFSIEFIEQKLNIDRNKTLIINPCYKIYSSEHKYYEIASSFIGGILNDYQKIIKNASKVIVSDSSFMCLALNLEIATDDCFYVSRDGRDYGHLYEDSNASGDKIKRKVFRALK